MLILTLFCVVIACVDASNVFAFFSKGDPYASVASVQNQTEVFQMYPQNINLRGGYSVEQTLFGNYCVSYYFDIPTGTRG
jgi:hypothetical protein